MPNWKKLVVSGSDAHLSNLTVTRAVTASYFVGDGSNLTNVSIASVSTVVDTFSNALTKVVSHNFNSKNVIVAVYDNNDTQLIPSSVTLTDSNTVTITFGQSTTGKVVVAKGGHIVSGSAQNSDKLQGQAGAYYLDYRNHTNVPVGIVSSSRQIASQISGSFTVVSASLAGRISNISTDFANITNKPTLVSGSSQINFNLVSNKPVGLLSSSRQIGSQISGSFTRVSASLASRISSISTDFADIRNKPTLLSSSRQIASEISGSFKLTSASLASTITNVKSTYLKNTTDTLTGNLTVTGKITAQEFHTTFVSSSILYKSGSTKFGDTLDDKHLVTGSLNITGSLIVSGPVKSTSLSGISDRFVQTDSTGTLSATRTIITAYLAPGNSALPKLTGSMNWDINGEYIGSAITGTYQGQRYYSGGYFYEAVADDTWIRLIRG